MPPPACPPSFPTHLTKSCGVICSALVTVSTVTEGWLRNFFAWPRRSVWKEINYQSLLSELLNMLELTNTHARFFFLPSTLLISPSSIWGGGTVMVILNSSAWRWQKNKPQKLPMCSARQETRHPAPYCTQASCYGIYKAWFPCNFRSWWEIKQVQLLNILLQYLKQLF